MKIEKYILSSPFISVLGVAQKVSKRFKREFDDLNYLQAITLVALYFEGKQVVTPSRLARSLGVSESSVSQALTSLQKKKLIRRETLESDARRFRLHITPTGTQRVHRLIKGFETLQRRLEREIGANRTEQLAREIVALAQLMP